MKRTETARRVTLSDIARETGYSVNTVSRALRNMADISPETCAHIQSVARGMGYMANQIASSLRSGRTHTLAVVVGSMANPFYGIMVDSIQDAAQAVGYSVMTMCSREDAALERRLVEEAVSRRVDGILLFPTVESGETIALLKAAGVPFVLMSRYLTPGAADSVVCDEARGAYLATRHLIEAGCHRLAYVSRNRIALSSEERVRGFLRACDEAGLSGDDRRVCMPGAADGALFPAREGGLVEGLLRLKAEGFDGLFMFCDVEAWHALDAMQKSGRFSPDDFGIVSFDNIEGALSFPLPLCSVDCSLPEMARRGIELLRSRIHGDPRPPQTVVCPVKLVCRASCGKDRDLNARGDRP